jgi:hypothetical protein
MERSHFPGDLMAGQPPPPVIVVTSPERVPLARVTAYESFRWSTQWFAPDSWELKITDADVARVEATINIDPDRAPQPLFSVGGAIWVASGSSGGYNLGIVEAITNATDDAGSMWTIAGSGIESIFGMRVCLGALAENWFFQTAQYTGTVEHCAREIVKTELIAPRDPARALPGLALEPSTEQKSPFGSTETYVCQTKPTQTVAQALADLSTYSRLSFKITARQQGTNPGNSPWMLTFVAREGVDRRDTVRLSVELGSVTAYENMLTNAETATVAYAVGRSVGFAGSTMTATLFQGDATPTGFKRRECIVEAGASLLSSGLKERARRALIDHREKRTVRFEYNPQTKTAVYGTDFAVGDIVTVVLGRQRLETRVVTATETWSGTSGYRVELVVGTTYPDLRAAFDVVYRRVDTMIGLASPGGQHNT